MVRSRRIDDEQDIVEDSEPEREERRQRKGESGHQERRQKNSAPYSTTAVAPTANISETQSPVGLHRASIESQQSFGPPSLDVQCRRKPGKCEKSVASKKWLHDVCADECIILGSLTAEDPTSTHRSSTMMSVRLNHPSPPPIATIEGTQSLDSDSEDQCSLMQISRFAYQPPASVRLTLDTPLQHIKSNIGICEPGPSGRIDPVQSSVTVKHVLDEFSDPQLANLSKCVGCGLQWTSRKTAKQKRLHIEKCTKKNALASDTVRSLVGKEVQKSNSSKDSGASHDENMASSLLDSVIPERTAQKAKRQQVLSTIKPLPETRASILGRAKDVLGRTRGLKADGPGPDMQATQRFGTSLLARRNSGNAFLDTQEGEPVAVTPAVTRAFNVSAVDGKELSTRATEKHPWPPFPQTQEFGGSKLAQRSNSTSSAPTSYKRSPSLGTEHDRPAKARLVQDVRLS